MLQRLVLVLVGLVPLISAQDLSVHVSMRDGTRLAVDVHFPENYVEGREYPALLELTRYWRSGENPRTGKALPSLRGVDGHFLRHGYVLVKVDVRGSGASFGTRKSEYGREEVRDGYDLVDWVVSQPWSSGSVGAYGTSYTGTSAEFLAAVGHPAVKAVIPGWSDFDAYRSPVRPYGLHASTLMDAWGEMVAQLDANDVESLGASVRRVDADPDGELLAAAIAEHRGNVNVAEAVRNAEFRDQGLGADTYAQISSLHWKEAIEASGTPMLVLASWFDAGTAGGALERFQRYSNPQKVLILASNHGGSMHASPYRVGRSPAPPAPSNEEQFELRRAFFDRYLKGIPSGVEDWPAVRYYNLGEEAFHESEVWPPEGMRLHRFYLGPHRRIAAERVAEVGADEYQVDFGASTGRANRWSTQLGGPVLGLHDRGKMDERMLTYTSAPLEEELQVSGTPYVTLRFAADREDCAVLVYLEDVDPDGQSRYVTEGGLRAIHHKLAQKRPADLLPSHTFAKADAVPLVPGEEIQLSIRLWPTSVLIQKGHRVRLAIAGADADSFARVPSAGKVTFTIAWDPSGPSFLALPVIE